MITRETDYAMRLLRALCDGERRTVSELAEKELVPQPFAYKILKKLGKAGFIQVIRGAEGGYRLTADLERVSLYDLMHAMDENCFMNSCMDPEYVCPWRGRNGECGIHCHLIEIQGKLNDELRSHSLAELFRK